MSTTTKLTLSLSLTTFAAAAIGFAAAKYGQGGQTYISLAASSAGILLLIIAACTLIGRSLEKRLGIEPEELERRASEMASGYLDGRWAEDLDGMRRESAGARLAETVGRLSEVFRRTNEAAKAAIKAGHSVRAAMYKGFGEETKAEAMKATDELLAQAAALQEAIDFYCFDRIGSEASSSNYRFEASPRSVEEAARSDAKSRPRLRLLPRERPAAGMSYRPSRGFRPKLVLLRTP